MKSSLRIIAIGLISAICLQTADAQQKGKAPAPEALKLLTSDKVNLNCVFFGGTKGKESVPVIILHDWKQAGSAYLPMAQALQQTYGCAVIVPDLRGHGSSKTRRTNVAGETAEIDIERMNKRGMGQMYLDVEACKKHLMEQNNAGKLNIERLCIIGNGFGTILALNYAAFDWSVTQLPNYKMGRDVNGLILVSPINSLKGYQAANALRHPVVRSKISMQIIAPSNVQRTAVEASRLHKKIEKFRSPLPESADERIKKQDLYLVTTAIHTRGVGVRNSRNVNAWNAIGRFIELRLINQPFEWSERKNPLTD